MNHFIRKELLKNALIGIGIGCAIFTFIGIFFDILLQGTFFLSDWSYTRMAVGSMAVGMGYSIPSIAYRSETMPMPIKILIHMGIGFLVMLIVSIYVGWFQMNLGILVSITYIAGMLLLAFIIWFCFWMYYKREAKKMNEKIDEMKKMKK